MFFKVTLESPAHNSALAKRAFRRILGVRKGARGQSANVMCKLSVISMRAISIIIFLVVFIKYSSAGNGLARIKDKDGFTNVRDSASSHSNIVGVLTAEDLFFCTPSTSVWWRIVSFKNDSTGKQLIGYVHSSRIQLIDSLDNESRRTLFTNVLTKHRTLALDFHAAYTSKNSELYKSTGVALEKHSDESYSPILHSLSLYFCQTSDSVILQLFCSTVIADAGSANEVPSIALGECYICHSNLVLNQVKLIKNQNDRKLIYDDIEYGLINIYDVPEDGKSNNKEYLRLRKQLDDSRK